MTTLSIFGNFYIDSEERLQRMKDSFLSFYTISARQWLVNIRGQHKEEAMAFLEQHLGPRLKAFSLESTDGWFFDSRVMIKHLNSEFVLFWIEDHINLVSDVSSYDEILREMQLAKVDSMHYSFYFTVNRYELIPQNELNHIRWLDLTRETFDLAQKKAPGAYIIGTTAIFNGTLFKRIVLDDDERQAIKWPKETPFDFEKSHYDIHWLPIRIGLPKYELFASIDDDSVVQGSSLISRGLYPARQIRQVMGAPSAIHPIKHPHCQSNALGRLKLALRSRLAAIPMLRKIKRAFIS